MDDVLWQNGHVGQNPEDGSRRPKTESESETESENEMEAKAEAETIRDRNTEMTENIELTLRQTWMYTHTNVDGCRHTNPQN